MPDLGLVRASFGIRSRGKTATEVSPNRLVTTSRLPPICLHDLRHGSATFALAGGVDIKVVSEMLGHSSTKITSDIYTSVLPELAKEAAAKLVPLQSQAKKQSDASPKAKGKRKHKKNKIEKTPAHASLTQDPA